MIEVKNLTYSYHTGGKKHPGSRPDKGGRQVLQGLDFAVGDGEIFGFLGPNGSGKSTTQKILTGILKGYGGKISFWGQDISVMQKKEFLQKIGVLFES